jgi:hypothetical protein
MNIQNHIIRELYVPQRLIYRNQLFEIVNIAEKFIIKECIIKTVDGLIDTITINSPHPNAEPSTGIFCIPHSLRNHKINKNTLEIVRHMLCCFNLDDCYFTPWDEIEYKKG